MHGQQAHHGDADDDGQLMPHMDDDDDRHYHTQPTTGSQDQRADVADDDG